MTSRLANASAAAYDRHMPAAPAETPSRMLLRHAGVTVLTCLCIAAALTALSNGTWDVNLVYSLSIGLICWLTIDLSRLRWRESDQIPWPSGARGPLIVLIGIVVGFALGNLIGKGYIYMMRLIKKGPVAGDLHEPVAEGTPARPLSAVQESLNKPEGKH